MGKINNTYGTGYFIAHDADYRAADSHRRNERRAQQRSVFNGGEDDGGSGAKNAMAAVRQTFAVPFDLLCSACGHLHVQNTHTYINRTPHWAPAAPPEDSSSGGGGTGQRGRRQLLENGIKIFDLTFRCKKCAAALTLVMDDATKHLTGGFRCLAGCTRAAGDYLAVNERAAAAAAAAEGGAAETRLDADKSAGAKGGGAVAVTAAVLESQSAHLAALAARDAATAARLREAADSAAGVAAALAILRGERRRQRPPAAAAASVEHDAELVAVETPATPTAATAAAAAPASAVADDRDSVANPAVAAAKPNRFFSSEAPAPPAPSGDDAAKRKRPRGGLLDAIAADYGNGS